VSADRPLSEATQLHVSFLRQNFVKLLGLLLGGISDGVGGFFRALFWKRIPKTPHFRFTVGLFIVETASVYESEYRQSTQIP